MVNQNSSGWGESNPSEQHNKPSWSNKQPNQTAPDRWRNGFTSSISSSNSFILNIQSSVET